MEKSSNPWASVAIVTVVLIGVMYWLGAPSLTPPPIENGNIPTETIKDKPVTTETSLDSTLTLQADETLGSFLIASGGMTVYTFKNDKDAVSNCKNACAEKWPPYIVDAPEDMVGNPALTGEIKTITREDGALQVTYKGMPLYFYINDILEGDTLGNGVGGLWSIVQQ